MEHQYRRGIYRPNAQRLSISLAPLVAQRSLLFRVKADLATKTHYGELTPTEDSESASMSASASHSPALFIVTASASARIISAALSALSTCSVYSQDSWQGGPSPFAAVPAAALPARAHTNLLLTVDDTRRHAIAFSPSVQWEALSDDAQTDDAQTESPDVAELESHMQTPLESAAAAHPTDSLVSTRAQEETRTVMRANLRLSTSSSILSPFFRGGSPIKMSAIESETEAAPVVATPKKRASTAKRISRHAKALGKAMGHLSMQPRSSKKDVVVNARRQTTALVITHPHYLQLGQGQEYKLPNIKARVSPIRMSFIAKASVENASLQSLHAQVSPVRPRPPRSIRPPPTVIDSSNTQSIENKRSTTPPPPIAVPIITATPAARKGHRRYNSSPAVPHFNTSEFKGWNRDDMPPLPPMPVMPPRSELEKFKLGQAPPPRLPRSVARADSVVREHVRAVSVDC